MTSRTLARKVAKAASDRKAIDIVVLDFRKHLSFTDFFVICSGTSDRHVQAITDAIEDDLRKQKSKPISCEGYRFGHWTVLDYGNVVAHVFHQEERQHYRLEQLWHDMPKIFFKGINA
ncbi:MAG: ribosome silencing factor [Pseudomonadota bacterium]